MPGRAVWWWRVEAGPSWPCALGAWGRDEDQLLTIDQVAERLAVTEDWLRRRPDLPFIVKLSDGTVRYSSRRLATYIVRQTGR